MTTYSGLVLTDAPDPPTDVTANLLSPTYVMLAWTPSAASGGTVSGYLIYVSTGGEDSGGVGPITGTSLTLTGLQESTLYSFTVVAMGEHLPSKGVIVELKTSWAPTITVSSVTQTSLTVSWSEPPPGEDAFSYKIAYDYLGPCIPGSDKGSETVGASTTELELPNLQVFGTYNITVSAEIGIGRIVSSSVNASTLSAGM